VRQLWGGVAACRLPCLAVVGARFCAPARARGVPGHIGSAAVSSKNSGLRSSLLRQWLWIIDFFALSLHPN